MNASDGFILRTVGQGCRNPDRRGHGRTTGRGTSCFQLTNNRGASMNIIMTGRHETTVCVACDQRVPSSSAHACDTKILVDTTDALTSALADIRAYQETLKSPVRRDVVDDIVTIIEGYRPSAL